MLRDAMLDTARRVVSARRVVQYQNEIGVLAHLWYNALTTGLGTQTLGEEYCDLFQMDTRGAAPGAALKSGATALPFSSCAMAAESGFGGGSAIANARFSLARTRH